ncbi:voltage-dependent calcium channel gamma-5 subunit [Homalodisca vitripennis]|uniref:voltage-dependent calcium channel gamma-5 subunit n=1 Tax=Homalodisca vitripennis TaxID=197043 RepID=UPI001EECB13E|nr:voltage-dependent calcium channel gamma-5 subunit [Homalodisca vitripennis]
MPGAVTCLWILTPLTASLSLVIVVVAMTTNCWLVTEESMLNPRYNGTGDRDYLPKRTVSGLWIICANNPGENEMHCTNIEYFSKEEYSPDPNDSTMAIPYAVTRSAIFFVSASLLLLCGEFCCLCGHLARHRRLLTFVAGVIFIISGLLMLIGLVMYISVFKAEVGSKLRPRSQLQPPMFTFRYGYSFLLYVSGFMSSEAAGTCAVLLYIYWTQRDWASKRLELYSINHRRKSNPSPLEDHQPPAYPGAVYQCRRHPYYPQPVIDNNHLDAVSPGGAARRVYLDSDRGSPQLSVHGGVSTVSAAYYPYPCPWEVSCDVPWDPGLPRDITVSTTADINCDDIGDFSPHPDFVTFDMDPVPPLGTISRTRQDLETLRRTTPV